MFLLLSASMLKSMDAILDIELSDQYLSHLQFLQYCYVKMTVTHQNGGTSKHLAQTLAIVPQHHDTYDISSDTRVRQR
ncbi:hypothetical protein H6P81_020974 [Aristolochia fimbriata]|uniref:Uncharacterized protein n=1 Tax=Aristolochia fimbriata TaxID=158543 RepID=A0AAV7DWA7_ARIFI|nr:hypothetical protein H6P81_020974 [Aristolochia fimbriata]